MRPIHVPVLVLGLVGMVLALPQIADSHEFKTEPDEDRADAVIRAFKDSWNGYLEHAYPHDTLHLKEPYYTDDLNQWGATVVNSLGTAILMDQPDIVNQMLDHIRHVDFTTKIADYEPAGLGPATKYYLGGLLSGFDLLNGPMKHLKVDVDQADTLKKQALSLADTISIAFNEDTGVPTNSIKLGDDMSEIISDFSHVDVVGVLGLEWTRLSDISNNDAYANLVNRAYSHLLKPQGNVESWPGLVGTWIYYDNGTFADSQGDWGRNVGDFYKSLIKMYFYDPVAFSAYKDRWVMAADSTMENLVFHPDTRKDLTFLCEYDGRERLTRSDHQAASAGGNFILGGILLGETKYINFGLELTKSYFEMYNKSASGICPWKFSLSDSFSLGDSSDDSEKRSGSIVSADTEYTDNHYYLQADMVESLYYAYRATGEEKYREMAWRVFQSIENACRLGDVFVGIEDVTKSDGGKREGIMWSWWMAETLKYLYLIFASESEVQLQRQGGNNHYVFTTAGHLLRIRG